MSFRSIIGKVVIKLLPKYQYILTKRLRHKRIIKIVFMVMNLAMWKYENLYLLLNTHPKFKPFIVIVPCIVYDKHQQKEDNSELVKYFNKKNIPYFTCDKNDDTFIDIKKDINPDIIFYPQPYKEIFSPKYQYRTFINKLLCYYPYAFWTSKGTWSFNLTFHNIAWKLFYSTELHRNDAQNCAINKGRNIEIVGYPNADDFLYKKHCNIWKQQKCHKKCIIWAPHFTIIDEGGLYQSNFLWMADFMLKLAKDYQDKIQIAFKPHPRLYTELCKHQDWGKEKTEVYYQQWQTMVNTQLESGEYIDLFMTSDAMLHDSSSFTVEYHYSQKPVMFITNNYNKHLEGKSDFGKLAMEQHYIGKNKEDIIQFIENVVLKGNDPMKAGREDFFKRYLLPPNGKTVAQNTMDVFIKAFC